MIKDQVIKIRLKTESWFELDNVNLVTLMTALTLLSHSPFTNTEVISALVVMAVLIPGVRCFGPFWIGIGLIRFLSQVPDNWPRLDNHQHLINWWCLGLGLTLMAVKKDQALRVVSRLLIGLCFLFALIWKIRSPDFLNGDFFTWRFTTDSRLQQFAKSFLGLTDEAIMRNSAVEGLLSNAPIGRSEFIETGASVRAMALFAAWYTIVIEATVAVCYLTPRRFGLEKWAPWALFAFIVTVYPLAPVIGFALLLLSLSIGATQKNRLWTITATLLFIVMPFFKRFEDFFALFA